MYEINRAVVSLLVSLVVGFLIQFLARMGRRARQARGAASCAERLSKLTASLTEASSQVDALLMELSHVAADREQTVAELERNLAAMEEREKEITQRIEVLQKVPIPAAERFAELMRPSERRSAVRDYLLFGAGVLATTAIAVIMQLVARK